MSPCVTDPRVERELEWVRPCVTDTRVGRARVGASLCDRHKNRES